MRSSPLKFQAVRGGTRAQMNTAFNKPRPVVGDSNCAVSVCWEFRVFAAAVVTHFHCAAFAAALTAPHREGQFSLDGTWRS